MADVVEQVTEQTVQNPSTGATTTTTAVSSDSTDAAVTRAQQVVWFIAAIISVLLGIRFILSLLGANMTNAFSDIIYSLTNPLVSPFQGLFNVSLQQGVSRVEIETLVAMVVYLLLAWLIVMGLGLMKKHPESPSV